MPRPRRLTKRQVFVILAVQGSAKRGRPADPAEKGWSALDLGKRFGVTRSSIMQIWQGRTYCDWFAEYNAMMAGRSHVNRHGSLHHETDSR